MFVITDTKTNKVLFETESRDEADSFYDKVWKETGLAPQIVDFGMKHRHELMGIVNSRVGHLAGKDINKEGWRLYQESGGKHLGTRKAHLATKKQSAMADRALLKVMSQPIETSEEIQARVLKEKWETMPTNRMNFPNQASKKGGKATKKVVKASKRTNAVPAKKATRKKK